MTSETTLGGGQRTFEPTLWTQILHARDGSPEAMNRLIFAYWKPVYFYVRRWGTEVEDAKDLTQEFFSRFLERNSLKGVSPDKGSFRAFLTTTLRHFLVNEAESARAKRRGGGKIPLSLDFRTAETEYIRDPAAAGSPEDYFKKEWALAILQKALEALSRELPPERFEAVRRHLSPDEVPSYDDTARRLNVTMTDVKNILHQARRRYRELIREEIRCMVESETDIEEEIRDLFKAV